MEKQALLNTYINNLTMQETVEAIEQMIAANKKSYVVAINVDVVMKIEEDPYLKKVVDNADMVLVDGKPLVWISKRGWKNCGRMERQNRLSTTMANSYSTIFFPFLERTWNGSRSMIF